MKLRVLDLFSGIGGFSLGLERTGGFETVAFCEIDPFCRRVLAKHWPDVPCYEDVRTLTAATLRRDGIAVDVICGGFPCQDISRAGKRVGISGARSGLWSEYARLIGDLRPSFVIVENVSDLLSIGLGVVLGDLADLGYDASWECVTASAVGAPHRRDRIWIVAHPYRDRRDDESQGQERHDGDALAATVALREPGLRTLGPANVADSDNCGLAQAGNASANRPRRKTKTRATQGSAILSGDRSGDACLADTICLRELQSQRSEPDEWRRPSDGGWWCVEPDVGRVAYGVPFGVDRLRSLGNAVVPQIPEMIGRAILEARASAPAQQETGKVGE